VSCSLAAFRDDALRECLGRAVEEPLGGYESDPKPDRRHHCREATECEVAVVELLDRLPTPTHEKQQSEHDRQAFQENSHGTSPIWIFCAVMWPSRRRNAVMVVTFKAPLALATHRIKEHGLQQRSALAAAAAVPQPGGVLLRPLLTTASARSLGRRRPRQRTIQ
jgi:hypothetical protein